MARLRLSSAFAVFAICGLLIFIAVPGRMVGEEPSPGAVSAFNAYVSTVEALLTRQQEPQTKFLARGAYLPQNQRSLRQGNLVIEQLTPEEGADLPGAMLHDWRGTAFVPGVTATDFEYLLKNFSAYTKIFSPQVLHSTVLSGSGDHFQMRMRVRQQHIISVVMDTTYDVLFQQLNALRGTSISRSTRISEIEFTDTRSERVLDPRQGHGFLWRQNTYWSYEQRDGGLFIQIESISLTRSIPSGLGWVVRPFVESVPRDSLEFTLHSICNVLRKQTPTAPGT